MLVAFKITELQVAVGILLSVYCFLWAIEKFILVPYYIKSERRVMETTTFTPEQQTVLLNWLISQKEAGLTLEEVIQGIEDGTLTS